MTQDVQALPDEAAGPTSTAMHGELRAPLVRSSDFMRRFWRVGALLAIGSVALPFYSRVSRVSGAYPAHPAALLWPLLGVSALYVAACLLITTSRPDDRPVALIELGALLLAGVAFRAVVFGTPPLLSHDAYRYAWDPYLLAHGVNPYLHAPNDPLLAPLRDVGIWPNLNWRGAPTIYPPGAQAFFFAIYLVKPLSIWAVKWATTGADALVALLLLALLRRRQMDLRLALLVWWSPIAVIEFAGNAHLDVVAVAWVLLALLLAECRWRGARVVAGVALGMATLTKLYPLLFVLAIGRRRDRGLYLGLLGTIAFGYLPVLIGGSHSTGFLETYVGQRFPDQGILVAAISKIVGLLGGGDALIVGVQLCAALALCGVVVVWRMRSAPSTESVMLALAALYFALAPHTFPWYVVIVPPLVALRWRTRFDFPARRGARRTSEAAERVVGSASVPAPVLALWLFTLWMPFSYVIFAPTGQAFRFVSLSLATALVGAFPWIGRGARYLRRWRLRIPPLFVGEGDRG